MNALKEVPLYCHLCCKEFSGTIPAQQHFLSEAHRRKEDQKKNSVFQSTTKPYWCDPCNLQCNSADQFTQHIASPRHIEIVRRSFYTPKRDISADHLSPNDTYTPTMNVNISGPNQLTPVEQMKDYDFNGNRGYCYLCDIELTSQQHAKQHLSGSKHQKKKKQSEQGKSGLLSCSICKVPFSCEKNAQEHLVSSKHIKRKMELEKQDCLADDSETNLGLQYAVPTVSPKLNEETGVLADVPVFSERSVSDNQPGKVVSTPLTSSITLLGATDMTIQQNSDVPYTFDGKQGYCNICGVDFTSPQNAQQHLEGSKHQKAEKLWKEETDDGKKGMCNLCHVVFSGPECAKQHFASEKHKKRLELPTTNFTVMKPEKPTLAQKEKLTLTPALATNIQMDLPLNIQPDSTSTLRKTSGSQSPTPQTLSGVLQNNFHQPYSATSAPHLIQDELCLSVDGGSLPVPLAVGNSGLVCNQIFPNNMNPLPLNACVDESPQSSRIASNFQIRNHEDVKEYHFDGSRGWCNVCNIELTSQQHANQHLSGKSHSKALGRWKSSHATVSSHSNGHTNTYNHREAVIDFKQFENRPYRFDGNRGWCSVCNIELTSSQHASQHLSGKNHAKALAVWETAQNPASKLCVEGETKTPYEFNGVRGFCHVCKIDLTSEAHARQHLSGKPHEKALQRWNLHVNETVPEMAQQGAPECHQGGLTVEEPTYVFTGSRGHCFVCNIELTSPEHAAQHLKGRNHTRAEERIKMIRQKGLYPLECKVCLKSFSGQESAAQHFISAKHRSRAEIKNNCLSGSVMDQIGTDGRESPRIIMTPGHSPLNPYMCEVCQCPLNSFEQLSLHKKSPKHLKTVEKMNRYIAVHVAADPEFQVMARSDTQSVERNQDQTERKEQYSLLWNALRSGEVTTVQNVVKNAEPQEIVSLTSNRRGNVPITSTSDGEGIAEMTKSTLLMSAHSSNTGLVERDVLPDFSLRKSSSGFNPIVCSTLTGLSTGVTNDGLSAATVTPEITTDAVLVGKRTGFLSNAPNSQVVSSHDDDSDIGEHGNRSGSAMKHSHYNPLRNQNSVKHRGNKGTISSYEDLDLDEDYAQYRNEGQMLSLHEDGENESMVSMVSGASNILADGEHVSHTTDNNPSMVSMTRRIGDMSLLSDTESGDYPSSNVDLLSGYSGVGSLPKVPEENPYKGHFKYYCAICKRPMNTEKDWKLHLESRGHQQRAAVVQAPVRSDLGHIKRVLTTNEALEEAYSVTTTCPRSYQVELFCKTMEDDRVIFLPTGTGKTLVAVMTLSCMLKLNPRRPVLFLVDKVLLVLQQSKYILREIGEKIYNRLPLDGSYPSLHERELKIATLCGNLLPADSTPLYCHDVIVTTAAYADNLLQKKYIHWRDFSLVVFDEAHHCVKNHPFNRLLADYHQPCHPEERPKVLGLTASPAGRDSVENTYRMLQELFTNLGGARIAIVQRPSELQELEKYQSNAKLVVDYKPYSEEERDFRLKLKEYICHCYLKLAERSNLEIECKWDVMRMKRDEQFAENLDRAATDRFLFVLNSLKPSSEEQSFKATFEFLTKHTKIVLLALTDMDGSGIPDAVADLQTLATNPQDSGFHHAKTLGLPCDGLEEAVKRSAHSAQIQKEFEDNPLHISLYTQLFHTLTSSKYIKWKSEDNPMALILVRERAHAHRLSNFLKQTPFVAKNDLKVTSVVGHGSGPADGGMKVKQQKRVLDGVKRKRYHIIVATSVAEEGVDIPECELVVCMNPPSTVTGLVQMRGRARKKGSFFVILCKNRDEEERMNNLLDREKFMVEAANRCVQQV